MLVKTVLLAEGRARRKVQRCQWAWCPPGLGSLAGLAPGGDALIERQPREPTASMGLTVLPRATCCVPRAVPANHTYWHLRTTLEPRGVHPNLWINQWFSTRGSSAPQETLGYVWKYFWQVLLGSHAAQHPTVSRTASNTKKLPSCLCAKA